MQTFKKVLLAALVLAAAFVSEPLAWASDATRPDGRITVEEARRMIEERDDVVVLDVRTPAEFASGHIEGALNLDFYAKDFRDRLAELDKGKGYIVHCRSGARSARAWKIMRSLGFKEVYDMGGIVEWTKKGYPTTK